MEDFDVSKLVIKCYSKLPSSNLLIVGKSKQKFKQTNKQTITKKKGFQQDMKIKQVCFRRNCVILLLIELLKNSSKPKLSLFLCYLKQDL